MCITDATIMVTQYAKRSHIKSKGVMDTNEQGGSMLTLLHFDQKSDGRHVGFSTLPCRMYDTLVFFEASETYRRLRDT